MASGKKLVTEADVRRMSPGARELILGPEKPDGFDGNFICTKKGPARKNPEGGERYADYVSGRQLFYDWENEEPVHLSIECLDTAGSRQPALTAELRDFILRSTGQIDGPALNDGNVGLRGLQRVEDALRATGFAHQMA